MKAYLWTTGAVFALLTALHIGLAVSDWPQRARDPWFLLATALTAALTVWAWRLARAAERRPDA